MHGTEERKQFIGARLDVKKYAEHMLKVKGTLELMAMTLEGLANGMEAIEAANGQDVSFGDRIKEAMESNAVKLYKEALKLLVEIAVHFTPAAGGEHYPPMTEELFSKIVAATEAVRLDCKEEFAGEMNGERAEHHLSESI
jgi:hypothetical protein